MPRIVRRGVRVAAIGTTFTLVAAIAYAAQAASVPHITVINQVADQSGKALLTDPDLQNPWGLALGPSGGALWVANNGTNTSTLYVGGLNGAAVTKSTLTVVVDGGAPTGQVFSGLTDFVVTGSAGSGPARFMFSSASGDITGWNPKATGSEAVVAAHVNGAIYRGLGILAAPNGNFLLAADVHNNRIDVFNGQFQKVALSAGQFSDRNIPRGFAPFNVQVVGQSVYVAYAQQDSHASSAKDNGGFVDVYTNFGATATRIASNGTLNAPWGLAIAPASFGAFAGDLLVGNFGDGKINVYQGSTFQGQLTGMDNKPVRIERLWALTPGNAANGGTDTIWFSAGPSDGRHGIVGKLVAATS